MVALSRTQDLVNAAMRTVNEAGASPAETADMLMEIAMGLQQKPRSIDDLLAAEQLYRAGLALCPTDLPLQAARIRARLGTALMVTPSEESASLEAAREAFEQSLAIFAIEGSAEEIAEAEMNLGLVLQTLAGMHKARIQDAISAYQRALRTFDRRRHPQEFAILQNNLATAFLSIPFTDERSRLREALAVQAFDEGLSVVTLVDHPSEYAMLQNNLGNALQYVASGHSIENRFRALEAYNEALKVRDRHTMPGEYANTIANKANCLANLPDDPLDPDAGNAGNLRVAIKLYHEAHAIFMAQGEMEKAASVAAAFRELEDELAPAGGQVP